MNFRKKRRKITSNNKRVESFTLTVFTLTVRFSHWYFH